MTAVEHPAQLTFHLPRTWNLADLRAHLGGVPLERIPLFPPPGTAVEDDVVSVRAHEKRLYELENGVLLEKTMGWYESLLAVLIANELSTFVRSQNKGVVFGADGMLRILPGVIRIPDVSFVSRDRWLAATVTDQAIAPVVPDLVVEILSAGNTPSEMDHKKEQYLQAGVKLIWYIDPRSRTAHVFTGTTDVTIVDERGWLDGQHILPGFRLSLQALFEEADLASKP